ncbi:MAG TPA: hypothetical protein VFJ91_02565 [Gaiellaceae bacterium]|nr:hypothetical protein [Gaiellaceae bacterium]
MSESTDWPLGERLRVPAPSPAKRAPARRGLPRTAWALAAAAFLCGLAVSAAAFSMGWRSQAQRGTSAQSELTAATERAHRLGNSLASARESAARLRTQLAAARQAKAAAQASAQAVSRDASALASALVSTGHSADSVSLGAAAVGGNVDKLASELKTLTTYLTTTPTAQLDPGYVASQTAYLSKQLDALQAARGDLGSAISDFQAAAQKLADRAGKLAGSD